MKTKLTFTIETEDGCTSQSSTHRFEVLDEPLTASDLVKQFAYAYQDFGFKNDFKIDLTRYRDKLIVEFKDDCVEVKTEEKV